MIRSQAVFTALALIYPSIHTCSLRVRGSLSQLWPSKSRFHHRRPKWRHTFSSQTHVHTQFGEPTQGEHATSTQVQDQGLKPKQGKFCTAVSAPIDLINERFVDANLTSKTKPTNFLLIALKVTLYLKQFLVADKDTHHILWIILIFPIFLGSIRKNPNK